MDLQLKNKKALITGSTKGIGFATAKKLLAEGVEVYINGRSSKTVAETIEKLKEEFTDAKIHPAPADFENAAEVQQLIKTVGNVAILINNAGIFAPKDFEEITDEDWQKFFEVNVMSAIRLTRGLLPHMKKQNWGRIVFISSESAINIPPDMIHYGVTKTAMLSLSRGIAKSLKGTNITVNSILPGPTTSDGFKTFTNFNTIDAQEEFTKEFFTEARPSSIIQRFAEPEEVANLITYVVSPLASATTGASLRVDGGVVDTI